MKSKRYAPKEINVSLSLYVFLLDRRVAFHYINASIYRSKRIIPAFR